jgi:hypothetical protein
MVCSNSRFAEALLWILPFLFLSHEAHLAFVLDGLELAAERASMATGASEIRANRIVKSFNVAFCLHQPCTVRSFQVYKNGLCSTG